MSHFESKIERDRGSICVPLETSSDRRNCDGLSSLLAFFNVLAGGPPGGTALAGGLQPGLGTGPQESEKVHGRPPHTGGLFFLDGPRSNTMASGIAHCRTSRRSNMPATWIASRQSALLIWPRG